MYMIESRENFLNMYILKLSQNGRPWEAGVPALQVVVALQVVTGQGQDVVGIQKMVDIVLGALQKQKVAAFIEVCRFLWNFVITFDKKFYFKPLGGH